LIVKQQRTINVTAGLGRKELERKEKKKVKLAGLFHVGSFTV
jgi:hypothetical protein